MKKYNMELVNKYIYGEDIEDYTIDELEDDKEFIMLVIEKTNDKKIYDLCSERLKKDYTFVRKLIIKFKNDIEFICPAADFYITNAEDEVNIMELIIIMSQITENKNQEQHKKYCVQRDTLFAAKRINIERGKLICEDKDAVNQIGMGYALIYETFNKSKIVLDFYAKKYIDTIFEENNISVETMLHQQFNNPEKLKKVGINNYMLNFIEMYDSMLASYLSTNINLMKDFYKKIIDIINKWNKYNAINEQIKYNLIFNKVHEYMEENENDCMFTETDLLYYVGKELGVIDKINRYVGFNNDFANDYEEEFLKDTLNVSYIDLVHYNNVRKIITSILFNKDEETTDLTNNDDKGKILKFKTNNTIN